MSSHKKSQRGRAFTRTPAAINESSAGLSDSSASFYSAVENATPYKEGDSLGLEEDNSGSSRSPCTPIDANVIAGSNLKGDLQAKSGQAEGSPKLRRKSTSAVQPSKPDPTLGRRNRHTLSPGMELLSHPQSIESDELVEQPDNPNPNELVEQPDNPNPNPSPSKSAPRRRRETLSPANFMFDDDDDNPDHNANRNTRRETIDLDFLQSFAATDSSRHEARRETFEPDMMHLLLDAVQNPDQNPRRQTMDSDFLSSLANWHPNVNPNPKSASDDDEASFALSEVDIAGTRTCTGRESIDTLELLEVSQDAGHRDSIETADLLDSSSEMAVAPRQSIETQALLSTSTASVAKENTENFSLLNTSMDSVDNSRQTIDTCALLDLSTGSAPNIRQSVDTCALLNSSTDSVPFEREAMYACSEASDYSQHAVPMDISNPTLTPMSDSNREAKPSPARSRSMDAPNGTPSSVRKSKRLCGLEPSPVEEPTANPNPSPASRRKRKTPNPNRRITADPSYLTEMLGTSPLPNPSPSSPKTSNRRETISPGAYRELFEITGELDNTNPNPSTETQKQSVESGTEESFSQPAAVSSSIPSEPGSKQTRPLKSCLSSKKRSHKRNDDSLVHSGKKSVNFGSPDAAEFDSNLPTTEYTPMHKARAKGLFPLDKAEEPEDPETSYNSEILSEWDKLSSACDGDLSPPSSPVRVRGSDTADTHTRASKRKHATPPREGTDTTPKRKQSRRRSMLHPSPEVLRRMAEKVVQEQEDEEAPEQMEMSLSVDDQDTHTVELEPNLVSVLVHLDTHTETRDDAEAHTCEQSTSISVCEDLDYIKDSRPIEDSQEYHEHSRALEDSLADEPSKRSQEADCELSVCTSELFEEAPMHELLQLGLLPAIAEAESSRSTDSEHTNSHSTSINDKSQDSSNVNNHPTLTFSPNPRCSLEIDNEGHNPNPSLDESHTVELEADMRQMLSNFRVDPNPSSESSTQSEHVSDVDPTTPNMSPNPHMDTHSFTSASMSNTSNAHPSPHINSSSSSSLCVSEVNPPFTPNLKPNPNPSEQTHMHETPEVLRQIRQLNESARMQTINAIGTPLAGSAPDRSRLSVTKRFSELSGIGLSLAQTRTSMLGLGVGLDQRYRRPEGRNRLPSWIPHNNDSSLLSISVDMDPEHSTLTLPEDAAHTSTKPQTRTVSAEEALQWWLQHTYTNLGSGVRLDVLCSAFKELSTAITDTETLQTVLDKLREAISTYTPPSASEARAVVDQLWSKNVDGVKMINESVQGLGLESEPWIQNCKAVTVALCESFGAHVATQVSECLREEEERCEATTLAYVKAAELKKVQREVEESNRRIEEANARIGALKKRISEVESKRGELLSQRLQLLSKTLTHTQTDADTSTVTCQTPIHTLEEKYDRALCMYEMTSGLWYWRLAAYTRRKIDVRVYVTPDVAYKLSFKLSQEDPMRYAIASWTLEPFPIEGPCPKSYSDVTASRVQSFVNDSLMAGPGKNTGTGDRRGTGPLHSLTLDTLVGQSPAALKGLLLRVNGFISWFRMSLLESSDHK